MKIRSRKRPKRSYAEETAREIDCAVREIVARAGKHATDVLQTRRDLLDRGARALLDNETLSVGELQELISQPPPKMALVAGAGQTRRSV